MQASRTQAPDVSRVFFLGGASGGGALVVVAGAEGRLPV